MQQRHSLPEPRQPQRTQLTKVGDNLFETWFSFSTVHDTFGLHDERSYANDSIDTFGARCGNLIAGSLLYTVFDVQAWLALVVGGLLSFNIIFPSDEPDIARLLGMWSIWMFTVPSLRARECTSAEKDALNLLFLAIPLANVILPFAWKNFGFIFSADCLLLFGVFAWKGLLPFSNAEDG